MVKQYGPLIIHYISTLASPQEVCKLVGLCENKSESNKADAHPEQEVQVVKGDIPMLGNNECTWGPAYWCASRENAEKCKAVDHCKRTVWKN